MAFKPLDLGALKKDGYQLCENCNCFIPKDLQMFQNGIIICSAGRHCGNRKRRLQKESK